MKKKKGFTLVELLIVIAIIAVLAAIATPLALGAINDSKATAIYSEIKSIQTAELTHYVQTGTYPDTHAKLELTGMDAAGKTKNASYEYSGSDETKRTLKVTIDNSTVKGKVDALLEDDKQQQGLTVTVVQGSN